MKSNRGFVASLSRLSTQPINLYRKLSGDLRTASEIKRAVKGGVQSASDSALAHVSWRILQAESFVARNSFKGFAQDLLVQIPSIRQDLAAVPHLGALAPMAKFPATRLDYVNITGATLLTIRQTYPALGLGSRTTKIRYGDEDLSGLELTQAWTILLNWGHLFGTFATERNILLKLQSTSARKEFLLLIDPSLRDWAEQILNSQKLHRLFYCLAAFRVSSLPSGPIRKAALSCLASFSADVDYTDRADKTRWVFGKARQIAYTRLQAFLRIGFSFEQAMNGELVAMLRENPSLGFDRASSLHEPIHQLLDAIDAFHAENLFTSTDAATYVLSHLSQFKQWWDAAPRSSEKLKTKVSELFREPADWPRQEGGMEHPHRFRMRLPGTGTGWSSEVRDWLQEPNAWQDANFLISPLPTKEHLLVDVYSGDALPSATAHWIGGKLAEKNVAAWSKLDVDANRMLWRAIASFGLVVLSKHFNESVVLSLDPCMIDEESVGYAVMARSRTVAADRLRSLLPRISLEERRRELEAVLSELEASQDGAGHWLVLLGSVKLYERADANRCIGELDGACCRITPDGDSWTFLEHKVRSQAGAAKQLKNITQHMRGYVSAPVEARSTHGKALKIEFDSISAAVGGVEAEPQID